MGTVWKWVLFACVGITIVILLVKTCAGADMPPTPAGAIGTNQPLPTIVVVGSFPPRTNTVPAFPLPPPIIELAVNVTNGVLWTSSNALGPWVVDEGLGLFSFAVRPTETQGTRFWKVMLNGTNVPMTLKVSKP
jgi:hypothetical protein